MPVATFRLVTCQCSLRWWVASLSSARQARGCNSIEATITRPNSTAEARHQLRRIVGMTTGPAPAPSAATIGSKRDEHGAENRAGTLPRPPITIIARYWIDSSSRNCSKFTLRPRCAEQRAGDTRVERAQTERHQFVARTSMPMTEAATSRSRTATIARPTRVREGCRANSTATRSRQQHEVVRVVVLQHGRAGRGHRAAARDHRATQRPVDDHLRRQCRDCQVQALDTHRRQSDEAADHRRHRAGGGDAQPQRRSRTSNQKSGGECADAHERAVADRNLAGETGEQVEAEGADAGDQDGVRRRTPGTALRVAARPATRPRRAPLQQPAAT